MNLAFPYRTMVEKSFEKKPYSSPGKDVVSDRMKEKAVVYSALSTPLSTISSARTGLYLKMCASARLTSFDAHAVQDRKVFFFFLWSSFDVNMTTPAEMGNCVAIKTTTRPSISRVSGDPRRVVGETSAPISETAADGWIFSVLLRASQ